MYVYMYAVANDSFILTEQEQMETTTQASSLVNVTSLPVHETPAHLLKKLQQQTRDTLAMCQSAVYLTNDVDTLRQVKQQAQLLCQQLIESASEISNEGLHSFPLLSKAAKRESRNEEKKQMRSTLKRPKRLLRKKDPLLAATVPPHGRPKQKRKCYLAPKISAQISKATRLLRKAQLKLRQRNYKGRHCSSQGTCIIHIHACIHISITDNNFTAHMQPGTSSKCQSTDDTNSTMCQTTANVQESMQPYRVPQTSQLTGKTS